MQVRVKERLKTAETGNNQTSERLKTASPRARKRNSKNNNRLFSRKFEQQYKWSSPIRLFTRRGLGTTNIHLPENPEMLKSSLRTELGGCPVRAAIKKYSKILNNEQ